MFKTMTRTEIDAHQTRVDASRAAVRASAPSDAVAAIVAELSRVDGALKSAQAALAARHKIEGPGWNYDPGARKFSRTTPPELRA